MKFLLFDPFAKRQLWHFIAEYPEVDQQRTRYDQWWTRMQPGLVNEDAYQPPAK